MLVPRPRFAPAKNQGIRKKEREINILRDGLPKKIAVLLDFVQFSQTIYIGTTWGWGGRGRPLPKFFGTLAFKKVVKVVQIRGRGGGRGNLDKIQKNSYFFSGDLP